MNPHITRVIRDRSDPTCATVRIPLSYLRVAQIELMTDVTLRVVGNKLVIEPVDVETEWMDIHAEEFVSAYRDTLKMLQDPRWPDPAEGETFDTKLERI